MDLEVRGHDHGTVDTNYAKLSNAFLQINIPKSLLDETYSVNSSINDEKNVRKLETLDINLQYQPAVTAQ